MDTFNACAFVMPEWWQVGLGIAIVLVAMSEMREHSLGYTASVVIIGCAIPLFIHNFTYMAAAIVVSFVIAVVTRWTTPHHRS
jgi:hypothetical protein